MIDLLKKMVPLKWKQRLRSLLHKYTCPFCGHATDALLPIGLDHPVLREKQVVGGGRRAAGCPHCGSTDRERLIHIYLAKELGLFKGNEQVHILHFAPEKHVSKVLLAQGFDEYVCGDLFTEGYKYPDHVRNMNVLGIPFPDDHFDLVICNHVLEHVPADMDAMREIRRVLKPGGKAILQVPISKNSAKTVEDPTITDPKKREELFGQYDHIRIYGQDYTDRLASSGFKVKRLRLASKYRKYGLNPHEDLFVNVK